MRMPLHKIAAEGTTASLNFRSAAPADLVSLASEAASPSIRYDTNRLRAGQPLTDRPWVVPWIAEDLPESSLSSTGSPGRPVGCRMKKAWFFREIETPAPEDSAGFVTSALPVPGHRGHARAAVITFASVVCVKCPKGARKLMCGSRIILAKLSKTWEQGTVVRQ
ncbi:hypothetical protein PG984_002291 [Apiospora sp. TS-2023a]